jgi:hypothetical protein
VIYSVSTKSARGFYKFWHPNNGYSSKHAPQNMTTARISSGRYPCYQGSPHRGLLRSIKDFQSFPVICCKLLVASSIFLRAKIFKNPEQTFWHTVHSYVIARCWRRSWVTALHSMNWSLLLATTVLSPSRNNIQKNHWGNFYIVLFIIFMTLDLIQWLSRKFLTQCFSHLQI